MAGRISERYDTLIELESSRAGALFVARARKAHGSRSLLAIRVPSAAILRDRARRDLLIADARKACAIRHANLLSMRDVEAFEDRVLLVSDYLEGGSLAEVAPLELGPTDPKIALRIILDACAGVHAAHEARDDAGKPLGMVHGVLSPRSVMIGTDGLTRVSDFGLAAWLSASFEEPTLGGTREALSYATPEDIRGANADRRSDVFALAVMAWELFAGERLFSGASDDEIKRKVQEQKPRALDLPGGIDGVLERALEKAPGARYASVQELADALHFAARRAGFQPTHRDVGRLTKKRVAVKLEKLRSRLLAAAEATNSPSIVPPPLAPSVMPPSPSVSPPESDDYRPPRLTTRPPGAGTTQPLEPPRQQPQKPARDPEPPKSGRITTKLEAKAEAAPLPTPRRTFPEPSKPPPEPLAAKPLIEGSSPPADSKKPTAKPVGAVAGSAQPAKPYTPKVTLKMGAPVLTPSPPTAKPASAPPPPPVKKPSSIPPPAPPAKKSSAPPPAPPVKKPSSAPPPPPPVVKKPSSIPPPAKPLEPPPKIEEPKIEEPTPEGPKADDASPKPEPAKISEPRIPPMRPEMPTDPFPLTRRSAPPLARAPEPEPESEAAAAKGEANIDSVPPKPSSRPPEALDPPTTPLWKSPVVIVLFVLAAALGSFWLIRWLSLR